MGVSASDVVPFSLAHANLSELAEQVKAGSEKIITKNGERVDAALQVAAVLDDSEADALARVALVPERGHAVRREKLVRHEALACERVGAALRRAARIG